MYRLMLVTDQKNIRDLFSNFRDWNTLGFEQPIVLENVDEAKERLQNGEADAVSYLLPKEAGQALFSFLSHHEELVGVEPADNEERLRRELNMTRRILHEREEEPAYDDVLPMLQSDFYSSILCGSSFSQENLEQRVRALKLDICVDAPAAIVSLRMPQGEIFLDEIWRYGRARLENALRNLFEREEETVRYVLHMLNPHHMRMLALPKAPIDASTLEMLTQEHLANAQEDLKEYFDLEMDVHHISVYDSFYALCASRAQKEQA